MCYNIAYLEKRAERIAKHYGADFKPGSPQLELFHVNGFVHPQLFVLTSEEPQWIQPYTWGLIPKWCKDEEQAKQISSQTLNAKAETVFEKPSFRSITKKRCLIIVNGFYEWQAVGKKKYPYYIHLKEQDFFSMGGLYENWINKETGELKNTFSIITTEANPMMAKIHNTKKRMPFILPDEKEKVWIEKDLPKEEMEKLMQLFDEKQMQAHTISKLITDRARDSNVPEVMEPFEYPELQ